MNTQPTTNAPAILSLAAYAAGLSSHGHRVLPGSPGTLWVRYESLSVMRIPTFEMKPPALDEVRRLFSRNRIPLVSYLLEPDADHPANAWLYIAKDQSYSLDRLPPPMRRNLRRGLKELDIRRIDPDQILTHGFEAFRDTRTRVGLQDGTPEEFKRRFTEWGRFPGHIGLGAWKDGAMAAFLSIVEVEDYIEIEGCFSRNDDLMLRPNDTLLYSTLSRYLVERHYRLVSYGLSSVQSGENDGLHTFKKKVGFEAVPVHRAFVLHPLLRPFANSITLWGMNALLKWRSGDRRLRKAAGMLSAILRKPVALEEPSDVVVEQDVRSGADGKD